MIYPETDRPFDAIFSSIIDGIEDEAAEGRVVTLAVADESAGNDLTAWLEAEAPDSVIALGRLAYELYAGIDAQGPPPVVGALDATPDTHPGVAGVGLTIDPALLFARLRALSPDTERVLLVFNPARDQWLIEAAQPAASSLGLELRAYEATSLQQASEHFWNIFRYANPRTDALWLTVDAALVDDRVNLPVIIEQSWAERMVVFSNNLEHANRGVLFALYLDPEALGSRLATIAQELRDDPGAARRIEALRDVSSALNVRVGAHLGLSVGPAARRDFDLILGER